jgi:hypothetical protein
MRAHRIPLHFLIVGVCWLAACVPPRARTPMFAPLSVTQSPTGPVQVQPYPVTTPTTRPAGLPYLRPALTTPPAKETSLPYIPPIGRTQTAMPTAVPIPTYPVDAHACNPSDLQISARTEGYPTYLQFDVTIKNKGKSACLLQGPPDIKLVAGDGTALDSVYSYRCFDCLRYVPDLLSIPEPTQGAVIQKILSGKIGINPDEGVVVFMDWSNWCRPFPESGVHVRLALPGGKEVEGSTDAYVSSPCIDSDGSSLVVISRYYHMP